MLFELCNIMCLLCRLLDRGLQQVDLLTLALAYSAPYRMQALLFSKALAGSHVSQHPSCCQQLFLASSIYHSPWQMYNNGLDVLAGVGTCSFPTTHAAA